MVQGMCAFVRVCAVCFPRARVNLQFLRRCEASERENERERLIERCREGRNRMRKKTEERGHSTIPNFTSLPHDAFSSARDQSRGGK